MTWEPSAPSKRGRRRSACVVNGRLRQAGEGQGGAAAYQLPALAIEAQLEAQPLPAEQAQAIAQPVIASVLGGPDAEARRPTQPAVTPWYFVRS